jgi:cytochrome P450
MQRCQEEIDSLFPAKETNEANAFDEATVTYDDVNRLIYLGQVIKESLRLHPPVQIMARRCKDEVQLGDYLVPGDTVLGVCVLALHRHPDFWDNPLTFDPDRFSAENIKATIKHPFQYVPFSSGPRNCIGQRFATLELTIVLALVLRKFSVSMDEEDMRNVTFEETITCGPKNMFLKLTKR